MFTHFNMYIVKIKIAKWSYISQRSTGYVQNITEEKVAEKTMLVQ